MKLSEMLERASILDYVSQYATFTEKNGEYWCNSPLSNSDNTPSFSIRTERNVFIDFSSGASGNILNFIMAYHGDDIRGAIKRLKDWLGVEEEVEYGTLPIVAELRKYKPKKKQEQPVVHQQISPSELDKYRAGRMALWADEGITPETAALFGIGYSAADDAIVIPLYSMDGKLINFQLRTTIPEYKQLGLPKYKYRHKLGGLDTFWGWWQNKNSIDRQRSVILVEGAKSVLKLFQFGYTNSAAIQTSHINEHQLKILIQKGYDCIFALDKDADPVKDKNVQRLKRFCRVYAAIDKDGDLGEKDSPCDRGKEIFDKIYENRIRI